MVIDLNHGSETDTEHGNPSSDLERRCCRDTRENRKTSSTPVVATGGWRCCTSATGCVGSGFTGSRSTTVAAAARSGSRRSTARTEATNAAGRLVCVYFWWNTAISRLGRGNQGCSIRHVSGLRRNPKIYLLSLILFSQITICTYKDDSEVRAKEISPDLSGCLRDKL